MLVFLLRRLLQVPLLLFGVALVTFIVFNVVGGTPVYTLAGKNASPRQIHELTKQFGFDKPLFVDIDFLQRRWYAGEIHEAAAQLAGGGEHVAAVTALQSQVGELYDDLDFEGEEGFDATRIDALRAAVASAGIAVGPAASATVEAQLNALSQAVLAEVTAQSQLVGDAVKLLRAHLDLAVPELVQLTVESRLRPVIELASYELDTVAFQDFAVLPGDTPAAAEKKQERVRVWWAEHQGEYHYEFAAGRTLGSLFDSQFANYLKQVFTFDFGTSYKKLKPVLTIIKDGAPVSLMLTVPPFLVATVLGVLIGLLAAYYRGRFVDRLVVVGSVTGMSVSILVFIILGQVVLAHRLGWFPVQGYNGLLGLQFFFLPWILWIVGDLGADVRFFRTAMVDELGKDYIRTARAKGLSSPRVMLGHLLKNAMIPVLTYVIIALPYLYTGSLLLERYFGIPGLGKEMVEAVLTSDFPVIKALTVIGSVLFIAADILTNVAYALVDPRVRLS